MTEIQRSMTSYINRNNVTATQWFKPIWYRRLSLSSVVYRRNKNGATKATIVLQRLCDKDKYFLRCDSHSIIFEVIRLKPSIVTNKWWDIGWMDLKIAFLQEQRLNWVTLVAPPCEAESVKTLWKLKLGAYGLTDRLRQVVIPALEWYISQ